MFVKDLLERMARTWIQAFLATLAVGATSVVDVSTAKAAAVGAAAAAAAAVMGLLARQVGSPDNASFQG